MEDKEKIEELYERIWQLEKEKIELEQRNSKAIEFLKEFHNYSNTFKWCEQDYIDTIEELERILNGEE